MTKIFDLIILVLYVSCVLNILFVGWSCCSNRDWAIHADTLFYTIGSNENFSPELATHFAAGHEVSLTGLKKSSLESYLKKVYSTSGSIKNGTGNLVLSHYDAHHIIEFRPDNVDLFFKILNTVADSSFSKRYRVWHPPTIFYWPFPLSVQQTERLMPVNLDMECSILQITSVHWKDVIRHCIIERKVIPIARETFDVHQNIYFHFTIHMELDSGTASDILHSVWELYFINGHNDTKTVIREVFGDGMKTWAKERVRRRSNFRNVQLASVAPDFSNTRYQLKWVQVENIRQLIGGISLDILKDFEYSMNFHSIIIQGDWISQHANGTLNGTTADMLTSRSVDLMIGQTVPIVKRTSIMEFLQPTSENTLRAYVHQPAASTFHDIFVSPFELPLRLIMLFFVCLVYFSIRFTSHLLSRYRCQIQPEDKQFTKESWIWLIGTMAQQGWYKHPESISLRCIFISGTLAALICYVAYTAEITSSLSIESIPIQNLSDLFRSKLPMYVGDNSITLQEYIRGLRDQVDSKIINVSLTMGVSLIFRGPSSFLMYTHRFHDERKRMGIPDHVACNLYAFPLTWAPLPSAMGVPKHSPLREYFNYKIIAMKEQGLLDRYKKRMNFVSGINCASVISTRYRARLGLNDIFSAVIMLFAGYIFCLVFCCLERVYFYKWPKRQRASSMHFPWID